MCAENDQECSGREECVLHDPEKRNHCYVLWTMNSTTKETIIKLKVSYLYLVNLFIICNSLYKYIICINNYNGADFKEKLRHILEVRSVSKKILYFYIILQYQTFLPMNLKMLS